MLYLVSSQRHVFKTCLHFTPKILYILLCCSQISNSDTQGKFTMQLSMRQEEAPVCINAVHNLLIKHFQPRLVIHPIGMSTETDRTKRGGSHTFKVCRLVNPSSEELAQARMFSN